MELAWTTFNPDSHDYVALARGLNAGWGFAREVGGRCAPAEVVRLHGYPVLLASMPSVRTAIAATGLVGALVYLLVGLFAGEIWGRATGLVSALLLAMDIPSIAVNAQPMSDSLFQSLLRLAFLAELWLLKSTVPRNVAVAFVGAGLLALATIVRPVGILLPFLSMLPFLLRYNTIMEKRVAMALTAATILASPILAWTFRNQRETGVLTYSTDGPISLYFYTVGGVVRWRSHHTFESVVADFERLIGVNDLIGTPATKQSEMIHRAFAIIRYDPEAFAALLALSFVRVAIAPEQAALGAWFSEQIPNLGQEPWFVAVDGRMGALVISPAVASLSISQLAIWRLYG